MGSAVPVIGLGLQAASMFGGSGGTQYSPDPRAKYEADLLALSQAEQNAQAQQALLQQQKDVANQLADYQRESQFWQAQAERDLYTAQIENEYQQTLYNNNLQRTQAGMQDTSTRVGNTFNQMGIDAQAQTGFRNNQINQFQGQQGYNLAQGGRQGQMMDAQMQGGFNQAGNQLQRQNLGLQDVALEGQRNQLGMQNMGIDQSLQGLNQQASQGRQNLSLQEGQNNIAYGQQVSAAEQGRQGNWNQLLNTFLGNSEQGQALMARMQGMGLGAGTQGAGLVNDMNLDPRILAQQQMARSQYGSQLGQADIQRGMGQAQVDMGRSNLQDEYIQKSLGLDLQRLGITQGNADIARQQEANNVARRGLGLNDLQNQYGTQSFINNLGYEGQQDYLQRVLLPQLTTELSNRDIQNNQNLQSGQIDINQSMADQQYAMLMQQLGLGDQAAALNREGGKRTLDKDLTRQIASMDAARRSTTNSNDMQLAAQLAQLASGQYGLLSSIGAGLSNPAPRGGGGTDIASVLGGLGGLLGQAAQTGLLSGGTGRQRQGYTMGNTSYGATPAFNPNQPNYGGFGIYGQSRGGSGGF